MKRETTPPFWLLLALLLLVVLQVFIYYPQLPAMVASHFGMDGQPNGWSSKWDFFFFYFFILGLVAGIFFLLSKLLWHLPTSLINLPNKQYWLAEERREQTLLTIQQSMHWFGVATALFLIAVIQLVIIANLHPTRRLASSMFVLLLGAYYLYLIGWIIFFWRRFHKVT